MVGTLLHFKWLSLLIFSDEKNTERERMTDSSVIDLLREAVMVIIIVSGPVLVLSVGVGLIISIIQTTTSIQEQTLTFVPKIVVILLSLIYFSYFIIARLVNYTMDLFGTIPNIGLAG